MIPGMMSKNQLIFFIFNHLLTAGLPRLARPPRSGPCLEFGFQYALIRNNGSKKFWVEYWTMDLAWLKFAVAALLIVLEFIM